MILLDLNTLKDVSNISLTLVLTIATIYLAIYTYRLVDEARLSRKSQIQPCISIHLEQAETDVTLLFIVVRNIGQGMAYDLNFLLNKDLSDFENEGMKLGTRGLFKEGMKFFPPGHSKRYFLIETRNNYLKKMEEELILTATYKNAFHDQIKEVFNIRLSEQSMASAISPPDTYVGSIADSLKGIRKLMDIGCGVQRVKLLF